LVTAKAVVAASGMRRILLPGAWHAICLRPDHIERADPHWRASLPVTQEPGSVHQCERL
jgi:hypothetical protein